MKSACTLVERQITGGVRLKSRVFARMCSQSLPTAGGNSGKINRLNQTMATHHGGYRLSHWEKAVFVNDIIPKHLVMQRVESSEKHILCRVPCWLLYGRSIDVQG